MTQGLSPTAKHPKQTAPLSDVNLDAMSGFAAQNPATQDHSRAQSDQRSRKPMDEHDVADQSTDRHAAKSPTCRPALGDKPLL